jgi:hypothetical protein
MKNSALTAVIWVGLASVVLAGEGPGFSSKPKVTKAAGKYEISFAVSRETDVSVFIESGDGRVVRHLVSGVLGKNPPAPLKPGLSQKITWDGKADYGKPAGSGPFKVRVALGLGAKYEGEISDTGNMGAVYGVACAPDGTVYVACSFGANLPFWNGQQVLALGRDGKRVRTVHPFPSDLSAEEIKALGIDTVNLEGRPVPMFCNLTARSLMPQGRIANMAVAPDGTLLTLVGGGNIGAFKPDGRAAYGKYAGPAIFPGAGFTKRRFITVSSDGKRAYVGGLGLRKGRKTTPHYAVYVAPLPGRGGARPIFGKPGEKGAGKELLGGMPTGLAVDGKGHLLICDPGNKRVVVVSEKDGEYAGEIKAERPDWVAVNKKTGAVYLVRLTGKDGLELVKLKSWKDPNLVAKIALPKMRREGEHWGAMGIDDSGKSPLVWVGAFRSGRLLRIEDQGAKFGDAVNVRSAVLGEGSFVDLQVNRFSPEPEVYTRGVTKRRGYWWLRYNEKTGKTDKYKLPMIGGVAGTCLVPGKDGAFYAAAYPATLNKFDRNGKPLPWKNPRQGPNPPHKNKNLRFNKVPHGIYAPVSMTMMTHTVGVRGDGRLFMLLPTGAGGRPPKALYEIDENGQLVGDPVIWKVSDSAVGPKFDQEGNIYIAEQIRPVGQPFPPEFKEFMKGAKPRVYGLKGSQEELCRMYGSIIKFSPKGGRVNWSWGGKQYMSPIGPNPYKGEAKIHPSVAKRKEKGDCWLMNKLRGGYSVTGHLWMRMGISHVDFVGCNCENTRFDVDEFGRVWYPDMGRFRVVVLDTNGNEMAHFGNYGNADSRGPESTNKKLSQPDIAFSYLIGVGVTDKYAYMGDSANRRLLRAKLTYVAEEVCTVP